MSKEVELIKAIILSTRKNEICITNENKKEAKNYELVKEKCLSSFSEIYRIVDKNNILR